MPNFLGPKSHPSLAAFECAYSLLNATFSEQQLHDYFSHPLCASTINFHHLNFHLSYTFHQIYEHNRYLAEHNRYFWEEFLKSII